MTDKYDFVLRKIIPLIEERKSLNICDYGCGSGELLKKLQKMNPDLNYVGIDYFSKFTENNPLTEENIPIKFVDRESDEFERMKDSGEFDLVISTFALHHFHYPVSELQTICSMIARKGLLVIVDLMFSTETKSEITRAFSSFFSEIERAVKKGYHRHHYTLGEAKDLINAIPHRIINAETLHLEMTEEEKKEDKAEWLMKNSKNQEMINKNATEYWKSVWLPIYKQEEFLLTEFGIDFSSVFFICIEPVNKQIEE